MEKNLKICIYMFIYIWLFCTPKLTQYCKSPIFLKLKIKQLNVNSLGKTQGTISCIDGSFVHCIKKAIHRYEDIKRLDMLIFKQWHTLIESKSYFGVNVSWRTSDKTCNIQAFLSERMRQVVCSRSGKSFKSNYLKFTPQKMHDLGALNQQIFQMLNAEVFGRFILRCQVETVRLFCLLILAWRTRQFLGAGKDTARGQSIRQEG